MRLHVGISGAEQFTGPVNRRLLDHVNKFATAMEPVARITLERLVGYLVTQRLQHGRAHDVFRRNQFDVIPLPHHLIFQCFRYQRISLLQGCILGHVMSPDVSANLGSPGLWCGNFPYRQHY